MIWTRKNNAELVLSSPGQAGIGGQGLFLVENVSNVGNAKPEVEILFSTKWMEFGGIDNSGSHGTTKL